MIDTQSAGKQAVVLSAAELPMKIVPGGLKAGEAVRARDFAVFYATMEPGTGEDWHTHKAIIDTAYYVVHGMGRVTWQADGEDKSVIARIGDVVSIPGGVLNKIEAIGTSPWIIVAIHTNMPGDDLLRLRE